MNPSDQWPALRTRVDALPHPSGGKGFAYSQDMQEFSMYLYYLPQQYSTFSHPCRQSEDMLLWRIGLGTSVLVDELATSKQLSYVIRTLSSLFYTVLPIQNALLHK
jgi:hypothetical protein